MNHQSPPSPAKHSDLPWRIVPAAGEYRIYTGSIGENLQGEQIASTYLKGEDDEANAQYIVTCCNSHQALVEALKTALEQMNKARRFLPTHGTFGEEGITDYDNAVAKISSALSAANVKDV